MGLSMTIDYDDPGAPVVVLAGTASSDLVANIGATLGEFATTDSPRGLIVDLAGLRRRDRARVVAHLVNLDAGPLVVIDPTPNVNSPGATVVESRPAARASLRRLSPPPVVGDTDPAAQTVIVEVACPHCEATGTLVCGYGPTAGPVDAAVLAEIDHQPPTPERREP